ncbi:unnamed protein product [Eruca vesicaria subsp. sativa]|uniref:Protein MIS12 homolog n=1 Tax=Eruca vesicaria subsp. sativa TaxID=29727 RepID=A0ABC8J3J6_ERUVS|nr:unnamed protein product [Eruca vesicaria subsp. sativa]
MEGSKGEAVFDSMNLNPRLFINAALNTVDDVVSEAFDLYDSKASNFLKIVGATDNRSRELAESSDVVRGMIQSVLNNRLRMWEAYCLRYAFEVPQDFVLPESDESSPDNDQSLQDDQDLDAELASLSHKLNLVGKRSVELTSELQALESKSVSNQQSSRIVNEALMLYNESSVEDMFKEMTKVASELRAGIDRWKAKRANVVESARVESVKNHGNEFPATSSDGNLDELDGFLAELRKM